VGEGPSSIVVEVVGTCSAPPHHLHHPTIFIISMFTLLLLLKDLLTEFIVTCTLKNKLTMRLCLVEGYLASLHDLVSFKIEHTICSTMRCITKENTIDRPSLELSNFFPFLRIKHLEPKKWK
jgi:hypothetical protein